MQWADGSKVKNEIDQQIRILLGPKTEEDLRPAAPEKGKKTKEAKPKPSNENKASVKVEKNTSKLNKSVIKN